MPFPALLAFTIDTRGLRDRFLATTTDVEARLRDNPIGGREMLRQLLHGEPLKMDPLPDGGWKTDSMIFPIELPKCAKPRELASPGLRTGCERPIVARGGFEPPTFGL